MGEMSRQQQQHSRKQSSLTARVLSTVGLLGSVQVAGVACSVVRTKLMALWIGASGVGMLGLYQSALGMFKSVCTLNIPISSIPAISGASGERQTAIAAATMRLETLTGAIGALLLAILSPLMSKLSFGNYDYTWGFALLSLAILVQTVVDGRSSVLQGYGKVKAVGKGALFAAVAGTAITLPLIYWFRTRAIVPVIIIYSVLQFLAYSFYSPAMTFRRLMPKAEERALMKHIVRQGTAFTAGLCMGLVAEYVMRAWLESHAGLADVGLYQAGSVIIGSYLGMAFTAICMEFFPRLSANIKSEMRTHAMMNHEIMLVSRVLLPAILIFMSADTLVIHILYSSEFIDVGPYLTWAAAGTLPRGAAWCLSFGIIARGKSRLYMLTEGSSALMLLALSWLGWQWRGMEGLGMAYMGQMVFFYTIVAIACRRLLGIRLNRPTLWLVAGGTVLAILCAFCRLYVAWWIPAAAGIAYAALGWRKALPRRH